MLSVWFAVTCLLARLILLFVVVYGCTVVGCIFIDICLRGFVIALYRFFVFGVITIWCAVV